MTGADDAVLRWCERAEEELILAADRAAVLAAAVAADWLDDHGREWSERTQRVRRDLGGAAADAADAGRHLARTGVAGADPAVLAALRAAASSGRRGSGPRLGGTDGWRVDDKHGMHLAQLPDDGPG